jgi:hypothetical protein
MRSLKKLGLCSALVALFASSVLSAATGEVTLSGSTWTAKVDGVTKYTGTAMHSAVGACGSAMTSGVINIRASGTMTGAARIFGSTTVNGNGYTITSNYAGGVIQCKNGSSTGASNIKVAGAPWYGMYFSTCTGQAFSGISGTGGILMRIDNCAGGGGTNFTAGNPTGTASGSHAVETYGITNATLGTLTATDRGECGLLFNQTTTGRVTTVNATRCCYGGGYAGLRYANTNNDCYASGTTNSNGGGRGFFSLTGSHDSAVAKLNASGNSGIGIWIQDCVKVRVVSGTLSNNGAGCYSVSGSGSYANVTCN